MTRRPKKLPALMRTGRHGRCACFLFPAGEECKSCCEAQCQPFLPNLFLPPSCPVPSQPHAASLPMRGGSEEERECRLRVRDGLPGEASPASPVFINPSSPPPPPLPTPLSGFSREGPPSLPSPFLPSGSKFQSYIYYIGIYI